MTAFSLERDVGRVCDLIAEQRSKDGRTVIGIAGPPASGKSTLAEAVTQALNQEQTSGVPKAALLPMDGYHLDNRLLESRGLLARKGAPETFDAHGFCAAVRCAKSTEIETFYPRFDRQMDLAIANSIAVHPDTPGVVVEGNYLLLQEDPWASLRDVFSASVFVCPSMEALRDRLKQRWLGHGFDAETAELKANGNDLPNAERVVGNSAAADLHLTQAYTEFGVRYAF